MEIKWHYDENPPEPEEGCQIAYLAALYSEDYGICFTETAWYAGNGLWTDGRNSVAEDVYAWAEWPATPPRKETA